MAVVSSVKAGHSARLYTVIQARPTAGLQRFYAGRRCGSDRNGANPMTPEEVHRALMSAWMQMMPQVLPLDA